MKAHYLLIWLASAAIIGCGDAAKSARGPAGSKMEAKLSAHPRLDGIQDVSPEFNTESYDRIQENPFLAAKGNPLSTFSIDVDTASYANARRFLNDGRLPPPDAVRLEEFINYFHYDYEGPTDSTPFATHTELTECPWSPDHWLLRIGLKGKEIEIDRRPASNLVFLIDVSGSMDDENKLPLLKNALRLLVGQLTENDRLAIVVYAGGSGVILPSVRGTEKTRIVAALDGLEAGGSTHGSAGIQDAYEMAVQHFIPGGTNRVILATDGDFNVGVTNEGELTRLIEEKAKTGVFLSVLGFGQGNYKDSTMEKLADQGNGNYAYIDTLHEGRKVLVEQLTGTLITIAKDVKIQVEFNPAKVQSYRLLGYENRLLRAEDFNDDRKDAGEIGAGHTVTALYELVPVGADENSAGRASAVDELKYQSAGELTEAAEADELLTLKLRYKEPEGDESRLLENAVASTVAEFDGASVDHRFAAAVASFGMLLRKSEHRGTATFDGVQSIARENLGKDPNGYRAEFVSLVAKAKQITPAAE